jgi:transposase
MANQLKMAEIHSILTLRTRGWSFRRIARELGVHRETVARYVQLAGAPAKPANAPLGSGVPPANVAAVPDAGVTGPSPPQPANALIGPAAPEHPAEGVEGGPPHAPLGVTGAAGPPAGPAWAAVLPPPGHAGPPSGCVPYRMVIEAKLASGLSAVRIHQDLAAEHGATLSYHAVRRFVRALRAARPLPFRRMECAPGEEAQVDFGRGAPVLVPSAAGSRSGKPRYRRPHVLRIVLSHSRKGYSEAVDRQTSDNFIRCLENAFQHFGGVPRTLVTDNLKAAVTKADWFEPELNPKVQAFAEHCGTVILPTKPYTPRHKGKVERGVDYVQENGLKGRTFDSLADQNRFLAEWETSVADTRIHGTTRQQVGKVFEQIEKPALLPLPATRFPCFHEGQRAVNADGHVEVAKAYYSVPPEHGGRRVWARWDSHVVRIFDQRWVQIAIHARREPGRFATDDRHIAPQKRRGIERGAAWWLKKAAAIGDEAGRWAQTLIEQRGIHAVRVVMGLVSLTQRHPGSAVEQACRSARSHAAWRLRDVRSLLKRQDPPQERFEFAAEHPLIRSLSDYGQLVRSAFEEIHA